MVVEIFTFCLTAISENPGEINILRSLDLLWMPGFPFTINECAIVAKIRFQRGEEGNKAIKFSISDLDGKPIVPLQAQTIKVSIHPDSPSASAVVLIRMQSLRIENAGEYSIGLAVDNRHLMAVPLFARQLVTAP